MNEFIKLVAFSLISLIVYMILIRQNHDFSLLIIIAASCIILSASITYLRPVMDFFSKLRTLGGLDSEISEILLQSAGIGVLSEICSMVCTDAGNSSLAKVIQLVATIILLYISLPLFDGILDLVSSILGEI